MLHTIVGDMFSKEILSKIDAIAHGCNCFNRQNSGIAKRFVEMFQTNNTDKFVMESPQFKGEYHKLGMIDWNIEKNPFVDKDLTVINAYIQYFHTSHPDAIPETMLVNYHAVESCFKTINELCNGKRLAIPKIGSGRALGDWNIIKDIIDFHCSDVDITVVSFELDC